MGYRETHTSGPRTALPQFASRSSGPGRRASRPEVGAPILVPPPPGRVARQVDGTRRTVLQHAGISTQGEA